MGTWGSGKDSLGHASPRGTDEPAAASGPRFADVHPGGPCVSGLEAWPQAALEGSEQGRGVTGFTRLTLEKQKLEAQIKCFLISAVIGTIF